MDVVDENQASHGMMASSPVSVLSTVFELAARRVVRPAVGFLQATLTSFTASACPVPNTKPTAEPS